MATHSSILAWRILVDRRAWQADRPRGYKESDTTETKHSTHSKVSMEPMNPYERRIIHSALQANQAVDTHSEGEEPNRHVVITIRK